MQSVKYLSSWLNDNANNERYLFTLKDLRSLLPEMSDIAFKTCLSRAVKTNYLKRVSRGLYIHEKSMPYEGLVLFHAISLLRGDSFNYISLETALSDAGVISQVPFSWITIMSSGRSNTITCGDFGTIEFVHTMQKPDQLVGQLSYDSRCRLWRADIPLALRDMKKTRRNCDLIDWEVVDELV